MIIHILILMKLKSDKKRVWLVGHTGLVGSALKRRLIKEDLHILTSSRSEVNLLNQHDVCEWVFRNAPDIVIMCAGKVGGIKANIESPYDFLYENTTILSNVINASHKNNIEKFPGQHNLPTHGGMTHLNSILKKIT